MFGKRHVLAATLLASVFSVPVALAAQPDATAHYPITRGGAVLQSHGETIDKMIGDFVAKNNLPGITMAIVQAPYIPRSAGYGRINLDNDELASTKTMWNVGPITQAFTAIAVFQLQEQHKLDIHDPVSKYVADLPADWGKVTILQLLQHSSGIPDFRDNGFDVTKAYQPADLLNLVRDQKLLFETGTDARLSATNFILLGLAVEGASGMSYHDYVTRYQIEPLGLTSTMFASDLATRSFLDRPAPQPGVNQHVKFTSQIEYIDPVEPATGYRQADGRMTAIGTDASASLYAFGGIWSSAEDISKWDIALAGSTLVKDKANRDLIYKPTTLANGKVVPAMAGWEFTHHPGFMEIKGNAPGFSAYMSRFTAAEELVCVTLLTNKEGVDMTDLARDIAEAYKAGLGADVDPHLIVAQESKFSADETVARIKARLAANQIPVFATFDHGANAKDAGLELRPTQVIVFGNAKVGTRLMQEQQAAGLDLPLRLIVWEDKLHRVWVGYPSFDKLAADYGLTDEKTIHAMTGFVETLVRASANFYAY
ncbi:serine hydrolase [Inquilinus sp.]|uniref:serine hydrolase n=1 Tax=Inquilinus sp. TaxID=1932117 RepID=UPI003784CDD4